MIGEAKAEADGMVSEARARSEQLLSEAGAKADGLVNEARTRAEIMLTDARSRAETVERQSQEKAASLERDAARRHSDIIGGFSQEKSALEKKINELHVLEREYRTRLRTYLAAQLRELDGSGSGAPDVARLDRQGLMASGARAHAEAGSR